jgi:hypothetical protein
MTKLRAEAAQRFPTPIRKDGRLAQHLRLLQTRVMEGENAKDERDQLLVDLHLAGETQTRLAEIMSEVNRELGLPLMSRNAMQKLVARRLGGE